MSQSKTVVRQPECRWSITVSLYGSDPDKEKSGAYVSGGTKPMFDPRFLRPFTSYD